MPRVLVLALDNWLGAARMPKALKCAGFDVSLLCYANTLVSVTKYADLRDLSKPQDNAEQVARRMIALIEANEPVLIIPVDDRATNFMHHILEVAALGVLPKKLIDLVRKSLPDESAFKYGTDKDAATELMLSLGFSAPQRAQISTRFELREFAASWGFPVVVKPLQGAAGEGVQILNNDSELESAILTSTSKWMVQRYIEGKSAACASVALEGRWIASLSFEKTVTHPAQVGPASVVTRLDNEEIRRGAISFAKATGYNGFYSLGYIIEERTGTAYFLECNARAVPLVPSSGKLGLDLCRALYARVAGADVPKFDDRAPSTLALYPQELHRDPNSPYRHLLLDEPLDDPLVHSAMQKGIEMLASGALSSMPAPTDR